MSRREVLPKFAYRFTPDSDSCILNLYQNDKYVSYYVHFRVSFSTCFDIYLVSVIFTFCAIEKKLKLQKDLSIFTSF